MVTKKKIVNMCFRKQMFLIVHCDIINLVVIYMVNKLEQIFNNRNSKVIGEFEESAVMILLIVGLE